MTHPSPPAATGDSRRASRRAWIGLAVLALPAVLASLELTVTNLALPSIAEDLTASNTQLLWTADIYAFLLAGSLITMGAWGDRIGRRRLLLIGAAGYGVASLVAAYAGSVELLVAARALMGVAGATLMPSTLSLAAALFPDPRQRTTAIGIIVASVSAGTAVGPLVGGWLLDRFWWGSAFLLAVPVMAALLLLVPLLLPEHRGTVRRRLDLVSALLSLAAVLPVVFGLKQLAAGGPGLVAWLALLLGLAAGTGFVHRQRRLADPFVDLSLFAERTFATAAATLAIGIFVLWGSNYAIAQYLQLVLDLSPLVAGLWTAPSAIGVIAGSMLAPRLARRFRPQRIIGAGLLLSAAGYLLLTRTDGLIMLVAGAVVVSAGLGPMMALATDLVVGSAPPERAGAAAAISTTAPQLGGALGIALLGSLITLVYRARTTVPEGLPRSAEVAYEESLAASVAATDRLDLGDRVASSLLAAARDAYVAGFQLAALASAVLLAATAVLVIARGGGRASRSITEARQARTASAA